MSELLGGAILRAIAGIGRPVPEVSIRRTTRKCSESAMQGGGSTGILGTELEVAVGEALNRSPGLPRGSPSPEPTAVNQNAWSRPRGFQSPP